MESTALGKHLHVSVVTVHLPPGILEPGTVYGYDLTFTQLDTAEPGDVVETNVGDKSTLEDLGLVTATPMGLGYGGNRLPSFSLPPSDLSQLRIVYGSCRKPHGEGLDALAALDEMIGKSVTQPNGRPHQLFLTGDQIYADDVADALLRALADAGDVLLGWPQPEFLPGIPGERARELAPGHRGKLVTELAGVSAGVGTAKSHLLKLGEYYAMYLFAWSIELWPNPANQELPQFADIYPEKLLPDSNQRIAAPKELRKFNLQTGRLETYFNSLPAIRRALANVPTFMIFDDHEITDDWYLLRSWCDQVLDRPLGRRFIQNGLLAYAVFQAWGNTPEQFVETSPRGGALLRAAGAWHGGVEPDDKEHERTIAERLLPAFDRRPIFDGEDRHRLRRGPNALEWHYRVAGPSHDVIVLDTRTWRGYPGRNLSPALLSPTAFDRQLPLTHPTSKEVVFVVAPGPAILPPLIDLIKEFFKKPSQRLKADAEDWSLDEPAFQTLLARLGQLGAFVTAEDEGIEQTARVVVLSGDVHYGYTARLQYWADKPFGGGGPMRMVVAQLTSSSLRNETTTRDSRGALEKIESIFGASTVFHECGYDVFQDRPPERRLGFGWANPGGKKRRVGQVSQLSVASGQVSLTSLEYGLSGDPIVFKSGGGPFPADWLVVHTFELENVTQAPDWRYRIDCLVAEHEVEERPPFRPREVKNPPPRDRLRALQSYLSGAGNRRDYLEKFGNGKEIVGVNNFGEVTFLKRADGGHDVVHQLWWRLTRGKKSDVPSDPAEAAFYLSPHPLSRWIVSMQLTDSRYPEPTVEVRS